MDTTNVETIRRDQAQRRTARAYLVSLLGPLAAAVGLIWAILQPERITLLHPRGQGLWWLMIEPPLLVVGAGLLFALVVARPLLADLEAHDAAAR
jgi:cytochrome bd-type quinol oxidase subunit 2